MDVLNQTYAQLKDHLLAMPPRARLLSGLLLAVVVIGMAFLFRFDRQDHHDYLMDARVFSAEEIKDIEAAFAKAGLQEYQFDENRIRVPSGQKAAYIGAIADAEALPPDFDEYFDRYFEQSHSILDTRPQQEARFKHAKQKELALIIRHMPGVERATVHYDVAAEKTFPRTKVATAMVAVWPVAETELTAARIRSIRHLVASSIADLKPEDVTVHDLSDGTVENVDDEYARAKRYYENLWSEKTHKVLAHIPDVRVGVNVELAREQAAGSTDNPLDSSNETVEQGSAPPAAAGPPLIPRQVAVTVSVPSDYYRQLGQQQARSANGKPRSPTSPELKKIEEDVKQEVRETVAALLPNHGSVADASPLVKVTTYRSLVPAEPSPPHVAKTALTWLGENWRTAGLTLAVFGGLLALWSIARRAATPVPQAPQDTSALHPATAAAPSSREERTVAASPVGRSQPRVGQELQNELTDMVRDDPDAAAAILNTWIGRPALHEVK